MLGLGPSDTTISLSAEMIEAGIGPARWGEVAAFLGQGGKTDKTRAENFRQAFEAWQARQLDLCLDFYLRIYFTDEGRDKPYEKLLTAAPAKARPDLLAELATEQYRLEALRDRLNAAAALERTGALLAVAQAVLRRYEHLKSVRGLLDFGDLIDKTLSLLMRSDARWVLYKLDRGIDHILVDEAQDTSQAQWQILEELMSDFAVGAGAGSTRRTFFAVGDDKQSIFSFQGAAPHMFHEMSRKLRSKFAAGNEAFAHVRLNMSFRSVPAILAAVDKIFEPLAHRKGVIEDNDQMLHTALKRDLPGLVELWPLVGAKPQDDPADWKLPLDALDEHDPASISANRVAAKIARLLAPSSQEHVFDTKTRLPRPAQPGDILILCARAGPFFEAVIRALKQANVPVAGADRLDLVAHIAVMDLIAAGRAALLPQDDLTLACVLKSPLIGLDDEDLLLIAPRRGDISLFDALARSPEDKHQKLSPDSPPGAPAPPVNCLLPFTCGF